MRMHIRNMIRSIAVAAFALAATSSAQAITPAPLHQPDGTHVRHACGAGIHYVSGVGCVTTPANRHARREIYRYDYNYDY